MNIDPNSTMRAGRHWGLALLIALVAGGLLAPDATAQTAEDGIRFSARFPATGARMMGLAGAATSGVADYSALFSNPAGLGFYRRSAVAGALNSVYALDESFSRTNGFSPVGIEEDASATHLSNLAYVYRAPTRRGSFVVAAGFNQVNSFERDLRFEGRNAQSTISTSFLPFDDEYTLDAGNDLESLADLPFEAFNGGFIEFFPSLADNGEYPFFEAAIPGTTILQTGAVIEEGRMSEASLGGAVEAARGVMVGLSANLAFGTYQFVSIFEEDDILDENGLDDYSVLLDNGELLEGFNFLSYRQTLESDLLGVNLRLGASAQATPNVRVGMMVETPTWYTVNEDFGQEFETGFDRGGTLTNETGLSEFEYEFRTPWRLGLGIGFHTANVSVMGDLEFVDWSQLEFEADTDPFLFDDLNRAIEEDYEPVINSRLGVEYRMGALMLRGGLAYQPDPLDVAQRRSDGTELDRAKTFFSAGFGYRFQEQFQLDIGWMQGRFDALYSAYPEDNLGPRQDADLLIDEDVVQNQFVIGVSFFF